MSVYDSSYCCIMGQSHMKQVVIIFGPPGSGKGTQSELLSEKLGLYYFETSKLLENKFKELNCIDSKKRFIKFN